MCLHELQAGFIDIRSQCNKVLASGRRAEAILIVWNNVNCFRFRSQYSCISNSPSGPLYTDIWNAGSWFSNQISSSICHVFIEYICLPIFLGNVSESKGNIHSLFIWLSLDILNSNCKLLQKYSFSLLFGKN